MRLPSHKLTCLLCIYRSVSSTSPVKKRICLSKIISYHTWISSVRFGIHLNSNAFRICAKMLYFPTFAAIGTFLPRLLAMARVSPSCMVMVTKVSTTQKKPKDLNSNTTNPSLWKCHFHLIHCPRITVAFQPSDRPSWYSWRVKKLFSCLKGGIDSKLDEQQNMAKTTGQTKFLQYSALWKKKRDYSESLENLLYLWLYIFWGYCLRNKIQRSSKTTNLSKHQRKFFRTSHIHRTFRDGRPRWQACHPALEN